MRRAVAVAALRTRRQAVPCTRVTLQCSAEPESGEARHWQQYCGMAWPGTQAAAYNPTEHERRAARTRARGSAAPRSTRAPAPARASPSAPPAHWWFMAPPGPQPPGRCARASAAAAAGMRRGPRECRRRPVGSAGGRERAGLVSTPGLCKCTGVLVRAPLEYTSSAWRGDCACMRACGQRLSCSSTAASSHLQWCAALHTTCPQATPSAACGIPTCGIQRAAYNVRHTNVRHTTCGMHRLARRVGAPRCTVNRAAQ